MSKRHVSVWKTLLMSGLSLCMIIGGFATVGLAATPDAGTTGAGLVLFGLFLGIINKLVFRVRTSQLKIDTMESHRDSLGYNCPECGARNKRGTKYCGDCGAKI